MGNITNNIMTKQLQTLADKYKASTPYKMRKLGDALIVAIPVLQGAVMGLPLDPLTQGLISLGIAVVLAGAKFLTNFYSE